MKKRKKKQKKRQHTVSFHCDHGESNYPEKTTFTKQLSQGIEFSVPDEHDMPCFSKQCTFALFAIQNVNLYQQSGLSSLIG